MLRWSAAVALACSAAPKAGAWKVVAVSSAPVEGEALAEFQTIFASPTFGY